MVDKKRLEELHREQIGARNAALEAQARPGTKMVMMRPELVAYYQGLEGRLEEALQLAAENHPPAPPMLVVDEDLVSSVVNQVLHTMADQAPALGEGQPVNDAAAQPEPVASGLPSEEWLPMPDLLAWDWGQEYEEPKEAAAWAAVYARKIRRKGRGANSLVNVADFVEWLKNYTPRG